MKGKLRIFALKCFELYCIIFLWILAIIIVAPLAVTYGLYVGLKQPFVKVNKTFCLIINLKTIKKIIFIILYVTLAILLFWVMPVLLVTFYFWHYLFTGLVIIVYGMSLAVYALTRPVIHYVDKIQSIFILFKAGVYPAGE